MPTDERVLCVPTAHFRAAGYFHGFRPADPAYRAALLDPTAYTFRPRSEVETDPEFQQLIPYVVLRHGNTVFHYRRGAGGTETRLLARRSVGIGGHISDADAAGPGDPYHTGMLRELAEEVNVGTRWTETGGGFINDDSTPVGSVHLGVVHVFELDEPAVTPREAGIAAAGFAPLAELLASREEFETWSRFVLAELDELVGSAGRPT
ncbi:MAG: phosphoesterase [Fimbriiglobus sp.]